MIKKTKWFFNLDKEESWLRSMAAEGLMLKNRSGASYFFHKTEPSEANIRIDYRKFTKTSDYENYICLFEDSGWHRLYGKKSSGRQYFIKLAGDYNEDIFSDTLSKAGRYAHMSNVWFQFALIWIPIFSVFLIQGAVTTEVFTDPAALYQTPGLWGKIGSDFWLAFAFETPFALLRGISWAIFPFFIIIALVTSLKARLLYKQNVKPS